MTNNKLFIIIIALILILFFKSCRIDVTNYFHDYMKTYELCESYQDTFDAENYDFHVGLKYRNEKEYYVLRYTYSNVKINLLDSLMHKRSKTFAKLVYDNLKNKNQFDKIEVLLLSEDNRRTLIVDSSTTFTPDKINFSFNTVEFGERK